MAIREDLDCDIMCSHCHHNSLQPMKDSDKVIFCGWCKAVKASGLRDDYMHSEYHRLNSNGNITSITFFGRFNV